ncbi:hypothetical protein N7471_010374 [Penicillium samsonianum]|uniref:uncharacterized protein n=1 Tax=Penicillium samsonianum TaxID=1882272 RepID=UPI002549936B|nr:uncharacterized protein N7471_010374 [Penicillium samsonianum]KAJ6125881.1 hypothetical protein N7471_010374 [Penicillium samsonianum]
MPQMPNYLQALKPTLVPSVLGQEESNGEFTYQEVELNAVIAFGDDGQKRTPWTLLIKHITSWTNQMNPRSERHFWDLLESGILSKLLHKGGDPNDFVLRDALWHHSAVGAYLDIAFDIESDTEKESHYLGYFVNFFVLGLSQPRAPAGP